MSQSFIKRDLKSDFRELSQELFKKLEPNEHLGLFLIGEDTDFMRFSQSKVGQTGHVSDRQVQLTWLKGESTYKKVEARVTISGHVAADLKLLETEIARMRTESAAMPVDPYATLPPVEASEGSEQIETGKLPEFNQAIDEIFKNFSGLDAAGIFSSGMMARGFSHSLGLFHWFSTELFQVDYSLYTQSRRASKHSYSGTCWDSSAFQSQVLKARSQLAVLERDPMRLKPGSYRTYLAPDSVHAFIEMFSWGVVGERSIRKSDSPFKWLRTNEKEFSPKFSLSEDFKKCVQPRFNDQGGLAPETLSIVNKGRLEETLVSARSASEFGLESTLTPSGYASVRSNGANAAETLRAPCISAGDLKSSQILSGLGEGLYLSQLHYLNWSDRLHGRITGMTRFACFWVSGGQIVAPIENLRFDDTLFRIFGSELIDFTQETEHFSNPSTYDYRQIGALNVPGLLLKEMAFTL